MLRRRTLAGVLRNGRETEVVEQEVTGLNPACKGFGHHFDKDIGCLANAFPATFRAVGSAVKASRAQDMGRKLIPSDHPRASTLNPR